MKYLGLIIVTLLLSGCFYQKADVSDLDAADKYCKSVGSEVMAIDIWGSGSEVVYCRNSLSKQLHTGTN